MHNVITIERTSLRQQISGFAILTTMAVLLARPDSVLSRIGSIACIAGALGLLVRGYARIDLQQRVVIAGFQIAGLMNVTRRSIPLSSVVEVLAWRQQDHPSVDEAVRNRAWHVELVLNDDGYLLVREESTTGRGEKAACKLASELAARLGLPLRIVHRWCEVRPNHKSEN